MKQILITMVAATLVVTSTGVAPPPTQESLEDGSRTTIGAERASLNHAPPATAASIGALRSFTRFEDLAWRKASWIWRLWGGFDGYQITDQPDPIDATAPGSREQLDGSSTEKFEGS